MATPTRYREAIDKAYDDQVSRLFGNLCVALSLAEHEDARLAAVKHFHNAMAIADWAHAQATVDAPR